MFNGDFLIKFIFMGQRQVLMTRMEWAIDVPQKLRTKWCDTNSILYLY